MLVVFGGRAALGLQVVAEITLTAQDANADLVLYSNARGYTSGTLFNNEN
jgi:hypothetical protein